MKTPYFKPLCVLIPPVQSTKEKIILSRQNEGKESSKERQTEKRQVTPHDCDSLWFDNGAAYLDSVLLDTFHDLLKLLQELVLVSLG